MRKWTLLKGNLGNDVYNLKSLGFAKLRAVGRRNEHRNRKLNEPSVTAPQVDNNRNNLKSFKTTLLQTLALPPGMFSSLLLLDSDSASEGFLCK